MHIKPVYFSRDCIGPVHVKKENDKMADDMRQQPAQLGDAMPDANVEQNAEMQPNA